MPKALKLKKIDGSPGSVYYPLELVDVPKPQPGPGEVLVKLSAAALNHRDLFCRRHLYPAISFDTPIMADGYGVVVELSPDVKDRSLLDEPVLLTPMRGWKDAPAAPEDSKKFCVIGSAKGDPAGMAQEYIAVKEEEVERAPAHLSPAEGAALPLVGLTGWRALVTKCGITPETAKGQNVLVTGVGGGVALQVTQFATAMGCNVYVTSGGEDKIKKAVERYGATAGVSYRDKDWGKKLGDMLPKERPYLDAVVDGAGGDIVKQTVRTLKPGGVIAQYGMTVAPQMDWSMPAVLKNIELKGTTMGSRAEFRDMVRFVSELRIKPAVSRVVQGLDNLEGIEGLFKDMDEGKQFGKLVIEIEPANGSPKL